jgi:hypothetical protein
MSDPNPTQYGPYSATHIPLHAKIALWLRDAAGKFTTASRASSPQIFANSGASSLTGLIPSSVVLDGAGGMVVANSSGAPEPLLRIGTVLPIADDAAIVIGNGTLSADLTWYGDIPTAFWGWDASANLFQLRGPVRTRGLNVSPIRYELKWVAGERGKPGINADILDATASIREIADPNFEVLGTNGTSASTSYYVEGGITLTTAGANNDQVIILPHLDASQSPWAQVTWGTDKETVWECDISTSSNITANIIWAGLKLTNTSTTATDDNQVFFRYAAATNSGKWQAIYSIAGTDTEGDSGVTVAVSTRYHLKISIDSSRIARMYINGVLVATSTALTNAVDFIPYIGVGATTGSAKSAVVHGQSISRVIG